MVDVVDVVRGDVVTVTSVVGGGAGGAASVVGGGAGGAASVVVTSGGALDTAGPSAMASEVTSEAQPTAITISAAHAATVGNPRTPSTVPMVPDS